MRTLLVAAVVSLAATACQSAPPPAPVDCAALVAAFDTKSGAYDYFAAREGATGPNATTAFDQMTELNRQIQASCR